MDLKDAGYVQEFRPNFRLILLSNRFLVLTRLRFL